MHLLAVDGDDALRRIDDQGTEIEELLVFGILGDDLGAIRAVRISTGTGRSATMRFVASSPSITGNMMSMMTRSGRRVVAA